MDQSRITIMQICDAVAEELRRVPGLYVQSCHKLTESIPDTPLAQVYFSSSSVDAVNTTDRTTFKAEVRQSLYVISIDIFAKRRSDLGEDVRVAVQTIDDIEAILEAQDECPPFGLAGIKGFRWETTFSAQFYADQKPYSGGNIQVSLFIH